MRFAIFHLFIYLFLLYSFLIFSVLLLIFFFYFVVFSFYFFPSNIIKVAILFFVPFYNSSFLFTIITIVYSVSTLALNRLFCHDTCKIYWFCLYKIYDMVYTTTSTTKVHGYNAYLMRSNKTKKHNEKRPKERGNILLKNLQGISTDFANQELMN